MKLPDRHQTHSSLFAPFPNTPIKQYTWKYICVCVHTSKKGINPHDQGEWEKKEQEYNSEYCKS